MKRRRYIFLSLPNLYHSINQLIVCFQPYVEQAARDKERAEKEKTDYDVRL